MKKRNKKLWAILLCLSMEAGLLGACGQQAEPDSGNSREISAEASGDGSESVSDDAESDASSERIAFKITVSHSSDQGDWNDYYFVKYLEEKFNVDLQFEMISSEVWSEKLPLMFTTNDLPDLFVNGITATDITTYGSQG